MNFMANLLKLNDKLSTNVRDKKMDVIGRSKL
jgi:hypothetical protein